MPLQELPAGLREWKRNVSNVSMAETASMAGSAPKRRYMLNILFI